MAIQSFRHRGLQALYETGSKRGVPPAFTSKIRRMLTAIDVARTVSEVELYPGWKLHPLDGDYAGFWGITVTGNWRLVFEFEHGEASNLDYTDYH